MLLLLVATRCIPQKSVNQFLLYPVSIHRFHWELTVVVGRSYRGKRAVLTVVPMLTLRCTVSYRKCNINTAFIFELTQTVKSNIAGRHTSMTGTEIVTDICTIFTETTPTNVMFSDVASESNNEFGRKLYSNAYTTKPYWIDYIL